MARKLFELIFFSPKFGNEKSFNSNVMYCRVGSRVADLDPGRNRIRIFKNFGSGSRFNFQFQCLSTTVFFIIINNYFYIEKKFNVNLSSRIRTRLFAEGWIRIQPDPWLREYQVYQGTRYLHFTVFCLMLRQSLVQYVIG